MVTFPFTCPATPPRLPRKAKHGQTICDEQGNIWEYTHFEATWLFRGTLHAPPAVTEDNDGLVTPDVLKRINYLREATGNARNLPPVIKLLPHVDAYWYLFNSSDKLVRFRPEGPSDLRQEVDTARLYSLLGKLSCPGDKGPPGDQGDKGLPGGPLLTEACYAASLPAPKRPKDPEMTISDSGRTWSFSLWNIDTPLLTEISIRLFDHEPPIMSDDGAAAIILMPPSGDASKITITILDKTIAFDEGAIRGSFQYDRGAGHLYGSITLLGGSWRDRPWCMRAKQKGPVGDKGDDAPCFFKIEQCLLPFNEALRVQCPIIQMRKGCNEDQVLSFCANLFPNVCVSKLRYPVGAGSIAPGSVIDFGRMAAVKPQLDECKDLVRWKFNKPDLVMPELELPDWTPLPGCQSHEHYVDFHWIPRTDLPADDDMWDDPFGTRRKKYPWIILEDPRPPEMDCNPCD